VGACPDEDEWLEVEHVSLDELLGRVTTGEIKDAKTIIGLFMAERKLRLAVKDNS
jgi:ADP-ribose pyrophosphatase